jgi:TM2 domain-containing membrane protein YozV
MVPQERELPLDPTPFIVLFVFGAVVAGLGRLYGSRLFEGLGLVIIAAAAVGFPVAEWIAA